MLHQDGGTQLAVENAQLIAILHCRVMSTKTAAGVAAPAAVLAVYWTGMSEGCLCLWQGTDAAAVVLVAVLAQAGNRGAALLLLCYQYYADQTDCKERHADNLACS